MISCQEYLKQIAKINEVLKLVPGARAIRTSLNHMSSHKKPFHESFIPNWAQRSVSESLSKLYELGWIKDRPNCTASQLHEAIGAIGKFKNRYRSLLEKKFDQDPDLAAYIKCHMSIGLSTGDAFCETMVDILNSYEAEHDEEEVKRELGYGALDLIGKYFEYEFDLKKFNDGVIITFGWSLPRPIHVDFNVAFPDPATLSEDEMAKFFRSFSVITL